MSNLNEKYNSFYEIILEQINKHAPFRKISHKQFKLSQKQWITKGILKSINVKNKYY